MSRVIVLDTETTGLDPKTGHRLVELACVELVELTPTGETFHRYIHPDREIDADAERVHGISLASLAGAPRFHQPEVCDAFIDFVGDSPLVAHNAAFDRGFVNAELERAGRAPFLEPRWVDTLKLAQKKFPGMYNSLDALCKRFKISLSERGKHGALIDAKLLAAVYLELNGGRERGLVFSTAEAVVASPVVTAAYGARPRPLAPRSTPEERAAHETFISGALKDKALWLKLSQPN